MSKLNRLIDLAKKTGDRLIVHDPVGGRDIVLLTIDDYEDLMYEDLSEEPEANEEEAIDEQVLIDRINRDISAWQSFMDSQQEASREDLVGEQGAEPTHWESAGKVMKERYQQFGVPERAVQPAPVGPPQPAWPMAKDRASQIEPEPQHIPYKTAEAEVDKALEDSTEEPIFFEEPLEEGRP